MAQSATAYVANPADEMIAVGPLQIHFLVTGADSQDSVAIFEMTAPTGSRLPAPAHRHEAYEETIYGLAGALTWTVDGQPIEVGPGAALCIPRGAVHRFDNFGTEDATCLVVASPAGIGPDYFREVGAALAAAGDGPPNHAKMNEIMLRHGLTPVAPAQT